MNRKYINHQGSNEVSTALFQFVKNGRILRLTALHAEDELYESERTRSVSIHAHPVYHIVLYLKGTGNFVLNHRLHPLQRGTLAISSPFEPHCFAPDVRDTVTSVEFTLQLQSGNHTNPSELAISWEEFIKDFFACSIPKCKFPILLQEPEIQRLVTIFKDFFDASQEKIAFSRNLKRDQSMLEIIAFLINCQHRRDKQLPENSRVVSLEQVRSEIEKHFNEPLTLSRLAAMANLSNSHFARQFKQHYQISAIAYKHKLRMEAAKVLLTTSDHPIARIAEDIGYADIFSFSRHFKKHFGCSPSHVRKSAEQAME